MSAKETSYKNDKYYKNMKEYGSRIKTLKSTVEKVRQATGMYIGSNESEGIKNLFREILQNIFDQIQSKYSPADHGIVTFDENSFTFILEDNGLGFPIDDIERIVTDLHTSMNFEKEGGDFQAGMHGVGMKIVCALSSKFVVISYQYDRAAKATFIDGVLSEEGVVEIPNTDGKHGAIVMFTPSWDVMKVTGTLNGADFIELTRKLIQLQPLGTTVGFRWIKTDGITEDVLLENKEGLPLFIKETCNSPLLKNNICFEDMHPEGTMMCQCLINYDMNPSTDDSLQEIITSFSNCCITSAESTHVKGFLDGICEYFRDYMNKVYLPSGNTNAKRKTPVIVRNVDIRAGLRAVVNVAHIHANFSGQAKEKLNNSDMTPYVKAVVKQKLSLWCEENPQGLQQLCKHFKEVATIRTNSEQVRKAPPPKYETGLNGFTSKYAAPTEREEELFIVEGDSAGGNAKVYRNVKTQGVMPIRGKGKNVVGLDPHQCYLTNAEIRSFSDILGGGGVGKDFDITKVKWKKIVFCADADSAGKHICVLQLLQSLYLFPGLVESGKVYKAIPPLYRVMPKNSKKPLLFTDEYAFIKYRQQYFCKSNTISDLDGRKLTTNQTIDLFYINIDYLDEMNKCSSIMHVDPKFLELFLFNKDLNVNKIADVIKQEFRFVNLESLYGKQVLRGSVNHHSNILFLTEDTYNICQPVIDLINKNFSNYYLLNGERVSIYELMSFYDKTKPSGVQRLKGLGEMEGYELGHYVLSPNEDSERILVQYRIDDYEREMAEIREIETDKYKLIKQITNVRKADIIE